ncbi:DUF3558 family protein [Actinosynnema sp. CA-299493]
MIKGLSTRVALSLAVSAMVVTGCTTGGTATPGTTGSTPTEQTSKTTTSTKPSGGGGSLADFDPCAVLESVTSQLNLTDLEPTDEKECLADYSSTVSIGLTKQPELAIGEAVGGEKSEINIGSRKALLVKTPTTKSSCLVAVEVTPTSRVDVAASADASLDEACEAATKVATAIEPKLPK